MLRASIDLMGGENAPNSILKAASNFNNVHFVFTGTESVKNLIAEYKIANYSFIEAKIVLEEGVRFSNAELEQSSLYIAIEQVRDGNADFVLSAGPSGYYMLMARRILGTQKDVIQAKSSCIVLMQWDKFAKP